MSTLLDYEKIERQTPYVSSSSLTSEEYSSLLERLEREATLAQEEARRQAHARAWELARQQGVEPIRDIKELQGDFWPEEESVDEFLSLVRGIRQQDRVKTENE